MALLGETDERMAAPKPLISVPSAAVTSGQNLAYPGHNLKEPSYLTHHLRVLCGEQHLAHERIHYLRR